MSLPFISISPLTGNMLPLTIGNILPVSIYTFVLGKILPVMRWTINAEQATFARANK
jgi:hypothetical protein